MSIPLAVAVFLLGTSVGALLVGLQRTAARRNLVAAITEGLGCPRSTDYRTEARTESPVAGRPNRFHLLQSRNNLFCASTTMPRSCNPKKRCSKDPDTRSFRQRLQARDSDL
jgi:hypothetical protein